MYQLWTVIDDQTGGDMPLSPHKKQVIHSHYTKMKNNTLSEPRKALGQGFLKKCQFAMKIANSFGFNPNANPNYESFPVEQKLTLQLIALSTAIETILDSRHSYEHAKEIAKQIKRGEM